MAEIDDLIKEKIKRLDKIGDSFALKSAEIQKTILKKALNKLENITRDKSGNIIASSKNLNTIQSVLDTVDEVLNEGEYQSLVKGLLSEMDKQAVLNDKILKQQFGETFKTEFADAVLSKIKTATELNLTQVSTAQITNGLSQYLNTIVSDGANYKDVYNYIQDYLIGAEDKEGALVRYTRQIANDSFAVSDRTRVTTISENLGIQFYRFQGGIIDTTRCFCEERNGLIFHVSEIMAWGDGDITAGDLSSNCGYPWAGMNTGTNSGNIFSLLGGYNCLHTLIPVSEIDVPVDVLRRAYQSGFYNPSETIMNLLGI